MNRSKLLWLTCAALPCLAIAGSTHDANAQAVVTVYPPSSYVASYEPIYYNGAAHYWWRDHWYWRDHGAWHSWEREPDYLRDHRGEWAHHWHHWR